VTILVTGSDGLIGSALRKCETNEDIFFATRRDADLCNFNETLALFKKTKPDKVIHVAAKVGGIAGNMAYSGDFFRENLLINLNVLESARLSSVGKLVSLMSTCIFPDNAQYPLTYDQLHLGEPHPSNFGYAYAKRMLDVQNKAYKTQYGLNYFCAIPTNVYGPHDNFTLGNSHVVGAMIHKTYLAKKNDTSLYVWGSGKPLREFVFSEDVARALMWLINNYNEQEAVIITSGKEDSIMDLVKAVTNSFKFSGEITFDSSKPDGQFKKPSSKEKLNELMPDFKFTELNEGIDQTVKWFEENYYKITTRK